MTVSAEHPRASRGWAVVIPVRGTDPAKTRLASPRRPALATAFARDTVDATLGAYAVAEVIVVTSGSFVTRPSHRLRVVHDTGEGLRAAIERGLVAVTDRTLHRAVLLGDIPSLRAADLDEGLGSAGLVPRGLVADADGTGSTLVTARSGIPHAIRFGPGSAALHRREGYRPLRVRPGSTLRHDVDRLDDLRRARELRVGVATAAVLSGS